MKKIFFCFIMLFAPIVVSAASVNYNVTDFLVDATIEANGDLSVKELIVLDGNFNGYERALGYKNPKLASFTPGSIDFSNSAIYNANGISNVSVYAKKVTGLINFNTFNSSFSELKKENVEKNAKDGDYYFKKNKDLSIYRMYYSANDEKVAFLISYTIDQAVVMHNDIAELYWTFVDSGFTDSINNLQIKVHLPGESINQPMRYWAHGDITGNINAIDTKTILATMKSLEKNNAVDLRIVFDKTLITSSSKLDFSEQDALDSILQIEEKRAQDANNQREMLKWIRESIKIITIFYYIAIVALWIYIYFKFDKEYKSDFHAKYYREFTGTYNVEVIDYLMNKNITPNAMSASIMNLIYKKNIGVEEIPDTGKKKKYKFTLLNSDNTNDTEQILLGFLFEEVGKDNSFTTTDLEKYAKSNKTCEKFSKSYTNWKNCVVKDAEKEKFYENNGIPTVIGILVLIVTVLVFMAVVFYQVDIVFSYLILPISVFFLFYTILIKKRTKKGNEDYLRWKAFKGFLNDFGNFKVKELPEIALWEKYLVYATVFGLADKVEDSMNVKIREYQNINPNTDYYFNLNPILNMHLYHTINRSVNNSVSSSIAATAARANSSRSSGSGFGGGFSSGGGFGGGGGGGGHGF